MGEYIEVDAAFIKKSSLRVLEQLVNQDEETALTIIEAYPSLIMYVTNPTQAVSWLALTKDPDNLRFLHKQNRDYILFAVKLKGQTLKWAQIQDEEIATEAVLQDYEAINFVHDITEDLAVKMIEQHGGFCLRYLVNRGDISDKVKKSAIQNDPIALKFLTSEEQTEDLCNLALEYPGAIEWISNPSKSMYLDCMRKDGKLLQYVELNIEKNDYLEIAFEAVSNTAEALQYARIQNEEIILKAVSKNGWTLKYASFVNEAIALQAVRQNYNVFSLITHPSEAVIIAAVSQKGMLLKDVCFQTDAIAKAAVCQDGEAIQFVRNQTEETCLLAIERNPTAFRYCRDKTRTLALAAIKKRSHLVEVIANNPDFDEDFFKTILATNGLALRELHVIKTTEMELIAVKNNWRALQYVDNFTEEVCIEAYNQDVRAIFFMCPALIGDAVSIKIEDHISAYNSFEFVENSHSVHYILSCDTMRQLDCQLRDNRMGINGEGNRQVSRKRMEIF